MTANPVTVFFPKSIVKGKKQKRTAFVTNETKKMLERVLSDLNDDDYIFGAPGQRDFGYRTEESAFDWVRRYTNMRDRYESNRRFKKNLCSFRSFCYTQSKLATGDADYAHGYIGHDRYLIVYERMQEQEKIDLFNRCVSRLSIFEDVVVLSDDELKNQHAREILELNQKYDELKSMILTAQRNPGIKIGFNELPNIEN